VFLAAIALAEYRQWHTKLIGSDSAITDFPLVLRTVEFIIADSCSIRRKSRPPEDWR